MDALYLSRDFEDGAHALLGLQARVRRAPLDREREDACPLARGLRASARRGRLKHEHALGPASLALDQLAPAEAARLLVARQQQHDGAARREPERAASGQSFERGGAGSLHVVDAGRVDAPFGLSPRALGQRAARVDGVRVAEQDERARAAFDGAGGVAEGAQDEVLAVTVGRVHTLD